LRGQAWDCDPPISAFYALGITGMSHLAQAEFFAVSGASQAAPLAKVGLLLCHISINHIILFISFTAFDQQLLQ
jgi:hypothetical protein